MNTTPQNTVLTPQPAPAKLPCTPSAAVHFRCHIYNRSDVEMKRRRALALGDLRTANYLAHVTFPITFPLSYETNRWN